MSPPPDRDAPPPRQPTPSPEPAPSLELYQFEGCAFCERVREALDDLGLDYVIRTVARSHPKRDRVLAVSGQTQVPVLVDHARGKVIVESDDIVDYLGKNYGRIS